MDTIKETRSIFLMQKAVLFITILMAINLASAIDISLDSQDSVKINEEFKVLINANSSETYDVKIFVHNSEDEKIESSEYISEIYNNGWKNPWFYIKEAFPEQKEYKIRVIESPGQREICARLRKTGSSSFSTTCNPIEILENSQVENKNKPDTETQQIEQPVNNKSQNKVIAQHDSAKLFYSNNEKIILNPPTQNNQQKTLITKTEKTRTAIIYSFLTFCIVLIVLLALRKL